MPTSSGNSTKRRHEDNERDDFEHEMSDDRRIPEITTEELQSAISKLKKGKSPDSNGIRAEDIKACDDETREMVRQLFNEIIKRNNFTPEERKKVKIKVIHKKGDVENVRNCPPDLLITCVVQTVLDNSVRKIIPNA